jgi:release factor glutamine methyltransferase
MNINGLLKSAQERLAPDPLARLEAEILLCHALEVSRSFLFANPELEVPTKRRTDFNKLLAARRKGEPVAYLVGTREFWTLKLKVTPDVLIPRPETEQLVEMALSWIPMSVDWRIADLGTGSGAIALAIASERPQCRVFASDISAAALAIAVENAERHKLNNVVLHEGSWLQPLSGKFDLILSNPPYVGCSDPHLTQGDCRFEPKLALCPGEDSLQAFREIAGQSLHRLEEKGHLLLEHGFDQGPGVRKILQESGYTNVETHKDLAGLDRISSASHPGRL